MDLPRETLTTLDESEHIETWIRCFAALTRVKKLKDEKASGIDNENADRLLATAGCETVKNISTMAYSSVEEQLTYEKIVRMIDETYTTSTKQKK